MPFHKLGHLQRSVLELAEMNDGYVWADLVYQELFGHSARGGHGEREPIDAVTRTTVSRVLWSLEKRGLLTDSTEVRGFRLTDQDRGPAMSEKSD